MKTSISLAVTASLACALFFSGCTKDNLTPGDRVNADNSSNAVTGDRIYEIVKDLSINSYSLHFVKSYPDSGITQARYGADSYLAFADPGDLKCPDFIQFKYKYVPIWRRPTIIWPTCPDMTPDLNKLSQIQQLLVHVDPLHYKTLRSVKFINQEGGFMGSSAFFKQYPAMQYDKLDDATANLGLDRFLMLFNPRALGPGATRTFYGYANINDLVLNPYKLSLKNIYLPKLIGCFYPETLKILASRLESIDPAYYKGITVKTLPQSQDIGVLSMPQ